MVARSLNDSRVELHNTIFIIDPIHRLKNIAIQHAVKERLMETLMDRILQNRFINQFGWNSAFKPGEKMLQDVDYYTKILEDRDDSNTFVDRTTAKAIAGAFFFRTL